MKYLIATLILLGLFSSAEARPRHNKLQTHCFLFFCETRGEHVVRSMGGFGSARDTVVSHPPGCPARAFCGCGAAVRVFGSPVRSLWLAANWFKFPRAMPAPGTVAVRRHHVMVLEANLGGGVWRVYDANSGGHATRIHERSIAGYTIVSPASRGL
jgi:hypothetical protein